MLESNGLPSFIAYGVFLGEILAPLILIVGYRVKLASLLILGTMAFILVFHMQTKFLHLKAWSIGY